MSPFDPLRDFFQRRQVTEPGQLGQQHAVEASPEWPAIKAAWAAREAS